MVDLHHERNLVRVLARHRAQYAQRRGHCIAAAFNRQFDDVLGVKVRGVLRERRAAAVFNTLIHRQDRQIAAAGQTPVAEHLLQAAQHRHAAVAGDKHTVNKIGPWHVQRFLGDGFAHVAEQMVGFGAQNFGDVRHASSLRVMEFEKQNYMASRATAGASQRNACAPLRQRDSKPLS